MFPIKYPHFRINFSTDSQPPNADKSQIILDAKDELKDENELDDLPTTSIIKYANSEITIEENYISSHEEHKQNNVTIHIFLLHILQLFITSYSQCARLEILRRY